MGDVYISYRRSFSFSIALTLYHALRAQGCDVFMDAHSLDDRDAVDFAQIDSHAHFLILLTPALIEPLQDADDPTRCEIEHAITARRNIIPILTNGFTFNTTTLPNKINGLRRYYGLAISPETLDQNLVTLNERRVKAHFFGTIVPIPVELQEASAARIAEVDCLPAPTPDQLRAETLFNRALARARQDHAAKRAHYDEVLRLNPAHVYARFERALERRRGGDDGGAFEDYNEILRLNPQFYKAYNHRAELYFTRKQYERALSDYERAAALHPEDMPAQVGKALALHALRRTTAALELWKPLLAQDERFLDAGWVGRELRLPSAMIDELHHLNSTAYASDH